MGTSNPTVPPAFSAALSRTLRWEGGYSNDAADRGGETYCGISRRNWPEWAGWGAVDRAVRGSVTPAIRNVALAADPDLRAAVERFYLDQFWTPLRAGEWRDAALAADVFDAAVNLGVGTAVRMLQAALGFAQSGQDGRVGPDTLAGVNAAPAGLQARFAALRAVRYGEIVERNPSQSVWLTGWLRRALAFALIP